MSKIALSPDLMRDIRDLQRRLAKLEALYSGPRFYGPFTFTTPSIAAGTESVFTYAHGLGVVPTAVLFEQEDGFFSGRVTTRIARDATNVSFVTWNPTASSATVVYRFMLLV
jgi:hypothetical protein